MVNHLLTLNTLTKEAIESLLERAQYHLQNMAPPQVLSQMVVANLFFEPSTRTHLSFEIAARRLGAITLNPDLKTSSLVKGESLLDTVRTLAAMDVKLFVIRHSQGGVPEWLAEHLHDFPASVINAGDGSHEHPTQGLLDLLTIHQHKPNWENLKIAIVGDILHSRVARSLIAGLQIMRVGEIRLIAPPSWLPQDVLLDHVQIFNTLDEGLVDADVIVTLRVQKERMENNERWDVKEFSREFGITASRLKIAKSDAIVMHPGPINREIEIASDVADGPQSVILQQVKNGVAVRMAVFESLNQS